MIKKYENFEQFDDENWDDEEEPIKTNKQGKEIIDISDITEYGYPDDILGFTLIEQNAENFDGEKGFIDYDCIIQREKDGKFFSVEYTEFGQGESDLLDQTAVEVKRKERMTYYYE